MDSQITSSLVMQQELDTIMGTTTRIPRLMNADGFPEWKFRFQQYVKMKEPRLWRIIEQGPIKITYTLPDGVTIIEKPVTMYDDDYAIAEQNDKALATICMALSPDIA